MDVVFIEAEGEENVGYLARLMRNFGLRKLILVSPRCEIGDKARSRSMHGWGVLKSAQTKDSFEPAISPYCTVIGTTAKASDSSAARAFMTPRELAESIPKGANACIVFGRESRGLTLKELGRCDVVVHIPASDYPTLSVSHAAAILFYELFSEKTNALRKDSKPEKEALIRQFSELARSKAANRRKPETAAKMFRSVISRAFISGSEAHGIAGVFSSILAHIKENK